MLFAQRLGRGLMTVLVQLAMLDLERSNARRSITAAVVLILVVIMQFANSRRLEIFLALASLDILAMVKCAKR